MYGVSAEWVWQWSRPGRLGRGRQDIDEEVNEERVVVKKEGKERVTDTFYIADKHGGQVYGEEWEGKKTLAKI